MDTLVLKSIIKNVLKKPQNYQKVILKYQNTTSGVNYVSVFFCSKKLKKVKYD